MVLVAQHVRSFRAHDDLGVAVVPGDGWLDFFAVALITELLMLASTWSASWHFGGQVYIK